MAGGFLSEIEPVFSADQIADRIRALAADIRSDAGDAEVFLLAVLKGAACFLADLMRAIPGEVGYGVVDVVRDVADNETADALEIDFLSFTDIRGRRVYVLKDVVATGVIENYLLSQLRIREPKAIKLVALLDRPDARTVELPVDFHAFAISSGTFAGYGLEHAARFCNLPYIGRIRE